jgi:hypothetical protein
MPYGTGMPLEAIMAALAGGGAGPASPTPAAPSEPDPLDAATMDRENALAQLAQLGQVQEELPVPQAPGKGQFILAAIQDALNAAAAVQERMPSLQTRSVNRLLGQREQSQQATRQNALYREQAKRQSGLETARARLGVAEGDVRDIKAERRGTAEFERDVKQRGVEEADRRTWDEKRWRDELDATRQDETTAHNRRIAEIDRRLGPEKTHEEETRTEEARVKANDVLNAFIDGHPGDAQSGIAATPSVEELAAMHPKDQAKSVSRFRRELDSIAGLSKEAKESFATKYEAELARTVRELMAENKAREDADQFGGLGEYIRKQGIGSIDAAGAVGRFFKPDPSQPPSLRYK